MIQVLGITWRWEIFKRGNNGAACLVHSAQRTRVQLFLIVDRPGPAACPSAASNQFSKSSLKLLASLCSIREAGGKRRLLGRAYQESFLELDTPGSQYWMNFPSNKVAPSVVCSTLLRDASNVSDLME